MDEALFYAQYLLAQPDRARFNREWLEHGRIPDDLHRRLLEPGRRALVRRHEDLQRRCAGLGIQRVDLLHDPDFADRVRALADPPGAIFLRGDRRWLGRRPSIGVVGARRGTERGRRVARRLGAELGRAGIVVVSGMALGIDAASHEGCLDAGGPGLAWLAGGVEQVTPPRHRRLYERLRQHGLLASEHPPGTAARPWHFVARNRLIAAYSDALVVVEAGDRSGTRSTVEFTLDLGHDVFCLPGPVDRPECSGTLRWIREGATMIRDAADLLEDLGLSGGAAEPEPPFGLGERPESTQEIARRTGLDLARVAAELARAQARGEIRRLPGDRWTGA